MTTAVATRRVRTPDGIGLAVRTSGDPSLPTVVCVHGYPDDSRLWDGVAAELSDRFHVVVYDVRGAGASDKPRRRRAYRMDVLEADFATVIDTVSPDRPVHLLAHACTSQARCWQAPSPRRLGDRAVLDGSLASSLT